MKLKFKGFLLLMVIGLSITLFAGCSGANAKTADGEKVLTIAFPSTVTTLDVSNGDGATMLKEVAGVIETLVSVDSDFILHPSLAKEWERTSEKTWVFKLRDDVTFHDGTKFNAEAVKWCIERSLVENTSLAKTTGIASVDVIDDYTVQFNTSVNTGDLPEALTNVGTAIVAKASVNDKGEFITAVGTGYFKQDSFDVSSGKFECVPYDKYWQKVDSNVTRRVVLSLSDSSTRSLSAQNGEVDIATDVPFSDLETLSDKDGINVEKFCTARTYFFSYNLNKDYLKDVNVRKALIYAVNKEAIVNDVLLGVGSVPKGIFMENMPWANTTVDTYEFDAKKAGSLLDAAGVKDTDGDGFRDYNGQKISMNIITSSRRPGNSLIVQAVAGYFANLGIEANVQVLDGNAFTEAQKSGNFDMVLSSAATGYVPSASYYLNTYYHSNSANAKQINYSNPELDKLVDACSATSNMEEKYSLSKQAQVLAQNDVAVYTIANYGAVFVLADDVENFSYSAAVHDFIVPNETSLK